MGIVKINLEQQLLTKFYVIRHLIFAKNPKYDGYHRELALMVYIFFDKKTYGTAVKTEIMSKQKLAEELHKPMIRKFENQNVYSFVVNIWVADLADMQLISKFNKGFRFFYVL